MRPVDIGALDLGGRWPAARLKEAVPAIAACLKRASDLWIFAYGSLMWDPGFAYCEAVPAVLHGFHRRFCVISRRHRGTPERPGLVLGLDRGGACRGVAFRIPAVDVAPALDYLWEREMENRVYRLKDLPVQIPGGQTQALAFVVDRRHPGYAGRLSMTETVRLIHQGVGGRGSSRQYLENTLRELERLGVVDGLLSRLARKVRKTAAGEARAA